MIDMAQHMTNKEDNRHRWHLRLEVGAIVIILLVILLSLGIIISRRHATVNTISSASHSQSISSNSTSTKHNSGASSSASGVATSSDTWPSAPPSQICGNTSILGGGPVAAPAGVASVPAGDNSSIDFGQNNTTYWFASGTHTLGGDEFSQITPGNNSTFVGAPGAVLDGQGKNNYAFTGNSTNVKVQYLTIQHFISPNDEGVVNHDSGNDWTIDHNTIQLNHGAAMMMGARQKTTYNCIADNGQYGFNAYQNGDGITDIVMDHNEIKHNDTDNVEASNPGCGCTGGGKFWAVRGATITNNYIHDNLSAGLWADTNNTDFLIQGNWLENNYAEAIFYEISYNAIIRNNVIKHNDLVSGITEFANKGDNFPTAAVYISESGGDNRVRYSTIGSPVIQITNNLFTDNYGGVTLWENANRFCNSPTNTSSGYCTAVNPTVATLKTCASGTINSEPYYSDCRWKTKNVAVSGNTFQFNPANANNCSTKFCGHMAILSNFGTFPDWSPYKGDVISKAILFSQNNSFSNNTYTGPWQFVAGNADALINWSTWRAAPYSQDTGSSLQ